MTSQKAIPTRSRSAEVQCSCLTSACMRISVAVTMAHPEPQSDHRETAETDGKAQGHEPLPVLPPPRRPPPPPPCLCVCKRAFWLGSGCGQRAPSALVLRPVRWEPPLWQPLSAKAPLPVAAPGQTVFLRGQLKPGEETVTLAAPIIAALVNAAPFALPVPASTTGALTLPDTCHAVL